MSLLSEGLLTDLVAELDNGDTLAVALAGSHARCDAAPYSDVDFLRFVAQMPEEEAAREQTFRFREAPHLRRRDGSYTNW